MENSFDDVSHLSHQNLGSSSPSKKQSKENTITVSGLAVGGGRAPGLGLWATAGLLPWQRGPPNPESMLARKQRSCSRSLGLAEVTPIPSLCQFPLFACAPPVKGRRAGGCKETEAVSVWWAGEGAGGGAS